MTQHLEASHFVPHGGIWGGLLFNNPSIGLESQLTLSFDFNFDDLEVDGELTTLGLAVEWAPWPAGRSWQQLTGTEINCDEFAHPVEASVYHYEHHRFDHVRLRVLEQDEGRIRVRVTVSGDIDVLGVPTLTVECWLTFEGIRVALKPHPASARAAEAAAAAWTSTTGLAISEVGPGFLLSPGGRGDEST